MTPNPHTRRRKERPMQPKEAVRRSGSGATADARAVASQWEREWAEADAVDRAEAARATSEQSRTGVVRLALLGVLAPLLAGIFPLTPGFASSDAVAAAVAAAVTAAAAVAVVPAGDRLGRRLARGGGGGPLIFTAALGSAGAAAIHLAVAKMHFDEYALFGVFFVGSGIAQLVWPIWLLLRRWRALLVLGALGNSAIVALWAVDRIWGLPLGPEHWEP